MSQIAEGWSADGGRLTISIGEQKTRSPTSVGVVSARLASRLAVTPCDRGGASAFVSSVGQIMMTMPLPSGRIRGYIGLCTIAVSWIGLRYIFHDTDCSASFQWSSLPLSILPVCALADRLPQQLKTFLYRPTFDHSYDSAIAILILTY